MADQLQKILADKKDTVETVMEVFEKGAEAVASIAGDLFPVFSIAAPLVQLALDNVESKEIEYMKEQFQKVHGRLDVMSEEVCRITQEIKKSGVDVAYFQVEENITNQFRKYMDILKGKPEYRNVKKKLFLEHFAKTGGEKNLNTLYGAVTGDNFSGESVLEITLNYEEKSRRTMEDFCARLKNLFCLGLIALLGHAALKECDDVEKILQDWENKIKEVQEKINAVIEDCINSFPDQAQTDICRLVRDEGSSMTNQQLADAIIEALKRKYDWVYWSVRIYSSPKGLFWNKKDFHSSTGKSRFQVSVQDEKRNVMVSYSASPEPLDKVLIEKLILEQKKASPEAIAMVLFVELPVCVVHTVKDSKDLACSWSFADELHFWKVFNKNLSVCIHSA